MAQSQAKPFSFMINQPVKDWLPRLAPALYLVFAALFFVAGLIQGSQVADAFLLMLISLFFLCGAAWIFIFRRPQPGAVPFVIFSASVSLSLLLPLMLPRNPGLGGIWLLALGLTAGAFYDLAFTFPFMDPFIRRYPFLRLIGYGVGVFLAVAVLVQRLVNLRTGGEDGLLFALGGYILFVFIFSCAWMSLRRMRYSLAAERQQAWLVLLSACLAFLPLATWFVGFLFLPKAFTFSAYLLIPAIIYPAVSLYIIQRHRIVIIDTILSRAFLYGLLAVLVAGGYALLVSGLSLLFNLALTPVNPILAGFVFFVVALLVNPLRNWLNTTVDAVFFRSQRAYTERVQTFSGELSDLVNMSEIVAALQQVIQNSLSPRSLHIFVYDPLSGQYIAAQIGSGERSSDLRFMVNSPLVQALAERRAPVPLRELEQTVDNLRIESSRLALLSAQLFAPLRGRSRLAGWCALDERLSGEPYSARDIAFLDSVCDQVSLAIERAQVIANLESRVRETTVLGRVAQGVNITIAFDDMLELIYAQTMQIIPADGYHLMLMNKETGELAEAFYAEGDERYREYENKPIAGAQSLEMEVVRQRRPILTDDYGSECQRHGILQHRSNIYAWMCVPLNAGAETIGALSLSRADAAATYSPEQLALLQSIADQAAGAITKSRLLQETERRARQLSTLNEVTRQLASTLELQPLLNNILHAAVEILNCEAGSLLQVDEITGELVFKVVSGPVAGNLIEQRLPSDTGVVGKAVKTRLPVMVNDVQKSTDWYQKPDEQTGFTTRALLAVPLQVKDRVTGVVEVINKRDGSHFNRDDIELLSAFAAQAAVAVENVRLFTSTDQALASRVEELSVMQRIDRELNTSLDIKLAMQITLEWAMRQAGTHAGWVGIVQEKGVRMMASQGYTAELEAFPDGLLPVTEFTLQEVIDSGALRCVLCGDATGAAPLLQQARCQVILPIRRETTTIGLLFMESQAAELISQEKLAFLQRLTDHAAVAIANAQLYAAVQSANLAKSEFVSFVAHELKNPMTSIKGFTELLAAGAVGAVNDSQANFLQTIRSNIERMNTLVSDLNDLSKIEAGRLRLEFKTFPMAAVVDDAIRSLRRQIDEKGQKLVLALPADLPQVWADRMRVSQVVINLISNAHKYTGQAGEITVGAEACPNQWDGNPTQQVVHVWVKDTGIGISPEEQKKVFQKFFRAEDPKAREVTGTGLGLNITKALVEMQGGKIWFESVFRQGTTFHFTMPVSEQ